MQAALKAAYDDPTNAGLKEAVEAYEAAYTKLSEAGTAVTDANAAATKAADQLNALEKQQAVTDAAAELESLKKVTIESVERKLNAAATDAKANYTKLKTDGTYDSAADSAALATDDIKKTVLADIAKAVNGITDSNKNSLTIKIPESGTAMDLTDLKAAATALKTAKDGMAGIESDLKSAQDEVVAKFNGPTVLTGKEIGLDKAGKVVTTANGDNAITVTANAAGVDGQISGFTISVSDAQGNIKKSANAALDNFNETIRAENESKDNAIVLQTGTKANQAIKVGFTDMRSEALGLKGADGTKLNISTQKNANAAINVLDNAIQKALDQQTTIGSVESRLEYTSTNLTTASENVQASESTIRDADMAKEMTEYTKNNVLLQAAQSMLAQANQNSSSVLSLLQ
ncbi:MAG: flagellin [Schwartzia sp.]|nr:flagellin [Schwartzia sp. (in: firmicutes)]